jgi:hypothetical protein
MHVFSTSGAHRRASRSKPEEIKAFLLTEDELKKIKGTHGFGSWKLACTGCGREFTEADVGGTIVSVPRKKPRHAPKFYYHLKCFNAKEGMNDAKKERK